MSDFARPMHIVVIGGSLGGLLTSIALLHLPAQHRVTILERSPTPLLHDQGAGIVAGHETLAWFAKHDNSSRRGELDKFSVLSRERLYLDRSGEVIDREQSAQRMTSWDLVYYLARFGFDGVSSGYVEGQEGERGARGRYLYGCNVVGVEEEEEVEEGRVRVRYVKGEKEEGVEEADFVVVADGPSSSVRRMVMGAEAERRYAGYVAFRGTVPEGELSGEARDVFVQRFTFFHGHQPNTQILAYTIPGAEGAVEQGKRLVNWVWYWNVEESSEEYGELMTDSDGKRHRFTLPTGGKMQKRVWERQLERAKQYLPPQFAEAINKTKSPFVQAITDLEPPTPGTKVGRFLNGKAAIVGDALAGFRPHTAASTSQAAFHALMLERVFRGEVSWDDYERSVLDFAWSWQKRGVMLGQRSQFGVHPLAEQGQTPRSQVDRKELHMRE